MKVGNNSGGTALFPAGTAVGFSGHVKEQAES
jgi:hypothetical protein